MPFPTYTTADEIPEAFRSEYEEKDGTWVAKIPDVSGATTALEKERQRARDEEKARKTAERERDELKRTQDAKAQGITEEQLQKIRDDEAKARQPIEAERDTLRAENRTLKLTDRVKALALHHGVMPDRITKAMKDLEGRVDLVDGGDTIVVKDATGAVTAETIDAFLSTTYKTEAPFFYAGTGASGSGAESSTGAGSGATRTTATPAALDAKRPMVVGAF